MSLYLVGGFLFGACASQGMQMWCNVESSASTTAGLDGMAHRIVGGGCFLIGEGRAIESISFGTSCNILLYCVDFVL